MRYFIFLVCFAGSLALTYYVSTLKNTEQPSQTFEVTLEQHSSESGTLPALSPPVPSTTSEYKWTDLEFQGESVIEHEGYEIRNTLSGLTISRNGRRFLSFKNNNGGWRHGVFGFRDLLKNGRKQLVFLSTTGGNHCCAEFVIVDFPKSSPQVIFRSDEYDVQMGEFDEDALMLFDIDGDGRLEITQTTTYVFEGCAMAANPVTYVGFRYNDKLKRYVPMRRPVPVTVDWIAERKLRVETENKSIENGQHPSSYCGYESDIHAVALSYVYTGRQSEGYNYFLENYRTLDYSKKPAVYNERYSQKVARRSLAEMRRTLAYKKLYRKLYGRPVLRHR